MVLSPQTTSFNRPMPASESDAASHEVTSHPTPDGTRGPNAASSIMFLTQLASEYRNAQLSDIESPQEECRKLRQGYQELEKKLEGCMEQTKISRRAQLCAEEKLRRQTEILNESNTARGTALEENRKLVVRLANLQKWTDCLDDDQARQTMGQLYQELQEWVKRHFSSLLPGYVSRGANMDGGLDDMKGNLEMLHEIYRCISHQIFEGFQTRVIVGIEDQDLGQAIYSIDGEVHRICPTHVGQHWRSAMSTAAFSLGRTNLEISCDRLIAFLEETFRQLSCTDYQKRTQQLKAVLWKFLEFKARLERQKDSYYFECFGSGISFCAEKMNDFTGEYSVNGVVKYTLSPALYKLPSGCDWSQATLVEKASVKTTYSPW